MKAVVLVSGGADSATCLALAVDQHGNNNVTALSVRYGQKHVKEIECAHRISAYYGVPLREVDLTQIYKFSNCSLLQHSTENIAHKSYKEQLDEKPGTVATYVPFRNGLMLSAAGALALSLYPDEEVVLYYGAHADDAAGNAYPDCSIDFVFAMNRALFEGSGKLLHVKAPLATLNKADVIAQGLRLGVPYQYTWSCYEGKDKPCGVCGTCIDRKKAFELNGVVDPLEYEV